VSRFAIEVMLHWGVVACYIVALAIFAHAIVFEHPKRVRFAQLALFIGLLVHAVALVIRWIAAGHGPYMLKYEVLSSNAWIAGLLLLFFVWRRPRWAFASLIIVPAMILMVALALFTNPDLRELPPTLRSVWLTFHILFNKLAAGSYLMSVATSVVLLKKNKEPEKQSAWMRSLPAPEALEAFTARFIGFGFIFWTITIGAGAIWANESWGRYWGWDPIETWSLITWLGYGSYLHLRYFFKIRGTTSAWLALTCFAIAVLTIFLLPFAIPSLHSAYFQ